MKIKQIAILFLLVVAVGVAISIVIQNLRWKAVNTQNRQYTLSRAAEEGNLSLVRACVEAGADVNAAPRTSDGEIGGWPPLALAAAATPHEDIVRYLLEHGANPNLPEGNNPLIRICWSRDFQRPSIAKLLLEHGADPNVHERGTTPLASARNTNQAVLVALLLQYGAHD